MDPILEYFTLDLLMGYWFFLSSRLPGEGVLVLLCLRHTKKFFHSVASQRRSADSFSLFESFNAFNDALMNAGMSRGLRLEMRFLSSTISAST
jgi:hypothetical protein